MIPISIPAAQFADFDDCLAAAADAIADDLCLQGWDLSPRWADDAREEILVDVPSWADATHCLRRLKATINISN